MAEKLSILNAVNVDVRPGQHTGHNPTVRHYILTSFPFLDIYITFFTHTLYYKRGRLYE